MLWLATEVEGIRNEKIQKELKVLHDIKSVPSVLLQLKKDFSALSSGRLLIHDIVQFPKLLCK